MPNKTWVSPKGALRFDTHLEKLSMNIWIHQPRHATERLSDSFCKQYNACTPPLFPRQEKAISLHGVKWLSIFSNVIERQEQREI